MSKIHICILFYDHVKRIIVRFLDHALQLHNRRRPLQTLSHHYLKPNAILDWVCWDHEENPGNVEGPSYLGIPISRSVKVPVRLPEYETCWVVSGTYLLSAEHISEEQWHHSSVNIVARSLITSATSLVSLHLFPLDLFLISWGSKMRTTWSNAIHMRSELGCR